MLMVSTPAEVMGQDWDWMTVGEGKPAEVRALLRRGSKGQVLKSRMGSGGE